MITLECIVPEGDAWTKHSVTIIAAFQGKGALVDEETQYIADNQEADLAEADAEYNLLVTQGYLIQAVALNYALPTNRRSLRLYRRYTLILKGTQWFTRVKAAKYYNPNMNGGPTDRPAEDSAPGVLNIDTEYRASFLDTNTLHGFPQHGR